MLSSISVSTTGTQVFLFVAMFIALFKYFSAAQYLGGAWERTLRLQVFSIFFLGPKLCRSILGTIIFLVTHKCRKFKIVAVLQPAGCQSCRI